MNIRKLDPTFLSDFTFEGEVYPSIEHAVHTKLIRTRITPKKLAFSLMVSIKQKNPDVNIVRGYLTSEKLGEKGMTIN